ncbi:Flavohemoprotein-like protein [Emericellopsis cladophorae]|uniref:nitric oxide dioxygenase n=1 Tax=Emericellopsis cladophorae TaxID=2686198 RepID=A0A9P9Y7N5_9HYPO|nr:Flavohemoprotein-like protein [Emericellopsis cladophorae]KAI6784583.1 Flavohemoprotein-like protein [Emericellopsis cladophorae]
MALTPRQVEIVKSTVPIIKEHGTTVTKTFYHNMLKAHPELLNYFSLRNQQTGDQQAALAKSVLAYATYIDDLGKLSHAVERIAHKHASLYVKAEQYDVVGEYLIGAFGEVLGDGLTPEVKEAWVAAYAQLAGVFIQKEQALYDEVSAWKDWRKFRIAAKEPENQSVVNLYLEPVDGQGLPTYLAGQYVSLRVPIPELEGLYQNRQFSLSEAPVEKPSRYRISVKREATNAGSVEDLRQGKVLGLISNILHDKYHVGDEVQLSAPRGEFFVGKKGLTESQKPLVLLSAGVGASALIAILDAVLASTSATRPIQWVHTARHTSNTCYTQHVREQAAKHNNLKAKIFVKETRPEDGIGNEYDVLGRMTTDVLAKEVELPFDVEEAEYYACGPEEWMVELRSFLESRGVKRDRVHLELFKTGDVDQ